MIELGETKKWWFVNDALEVVQGDGQFQSGVNEGWYFRGLEAMRQDLPPGEREQSPREMTDRAAEIGRRGLRRQREELFDTQGAAAVALSARLQEKIDFYQAKLNTARRWSL